jgi:3-phosphoshikimate 1-carboxyvinyltransferase
VIASFADGTTRIYGAERLRIKESDRLKTTASMLNSMGGSAEETPDGLIIKGKALGGGQVNGSNDHRIVMSAAVAALGCADKVEITDKESINKSYPNFFEEYERLGGKIYV